MSSSPFVPTVDHLTVDSAGLKLAVQVSGPKDAPAIVLVHGYPDNHEVWDGVRLVLGTRFRIVTYDCRGAGRSDAPRGLAAYRIEHFVGDLEAVTSAVIPGRGFHLVGHDWGSIHSWESVTTPRLQGRILSYTSISGPSLDHVSAWSRLPAPQGPTPGQRIGQAFSSWYIFLFHLPLLPELVWLLLTAWMWPWFLRVTEGVTGAPNPTQLRDGIMGIALYRANILPRMLKPRPRPAHAPVQLVVACKDRYVRPAVAQALAVAVPQYQRRELPEAGHWVVRRQPQLVAACIAEFVGQVERSRTAGTSQPVPA